MMIFNERWVRRQKSSDFLNFTRVEIMEKPVVRFETWSIIFYILECTPNLMIFFTERCVLIKIRNCYVITKYD